MASPITFGGLASGLDTKAIIAALVAVEGQKVTLLQNRQSGFKDKLGAYDGLLAKLNTLQTALGKISDPNKFNAFAAHLSTGGESYLAATTLGTAHAGAYQVSVGTLAQSTFIRSDGFDDADASLGIVGTMTLNVGTTSTNVVIDGTNNSLFGIRDAIRESDAAVDATVVFDGTKYHLEVRGRETGLKNAVTVAAEPGLPPPDGPVLNLAQIRAAGDAAFQIDGQDYTSSSNTVTGAIEGVTLQLLDDQAVGAAPIHVTVTQDVEQVQQQLQDFVTAYNAVIAIMNDQASPRASVTDPVKPLSGESSLRSLRLDFGDAISASTDFVTRYQTFSSIGITSQNDGTLAFNTKKFQDAITADVDGVNQLLTDATQGLGRKLLAEVKQRTNAARGTLHMREDALHDQISSLDKRIREAQDALSKYQDSLVNRFAAYETLIGQLKSQGDSLAAISATTAGIANSSNS